ncbi:uncharacterized protein LOC124438924 [Xenia sp. Carnegie-2017]|uniref:uncharacterized protein LOC124438924 n=1 Tax=Xenia sp. Carnegie-2017 TaxID=2897299 RepID=UPI001F03B7C9|nr:uncharacterized protein LOC124438924 [Xenia sp. Carnegie-2017]
MERAIAIYQFQGRDEDELTVNKNDILDIILKSKDWWTVRGKDGKIGLIPVIFLAAPIDDPSTKVVSRGKITKEYRSNSKTEISVDLGAQIAIFDKMMNTGGLLDGMGRLVIYQRKSLRNSCQKRDQTQMPI